MERQDAYPGDPSFAGPGTRNFMLSAEQSSAYSWQGVMEFLKVQEKNSFSRE